jgi:CYTH domain-containing protein/CHAD domain-containing protein
MHLDCGALKDRARRTARLVAEDLLSSVKKKHEALVADEPDGLHDFRVDVRRLRSWLRAFSGDFDDTLRGRDRRRLKRIADATRASRDLEVHIEWVDRFAKSRRRSTRAGTNWLVARLRSRLARADLDLQQVIEREFDRAARRIGEAIGRYTVGLDERPTPFARVAAKLIRSHADRARTALSRVSTIGDRAESHAARIAAKRLRYLLDPLADSIDTVPPLVERLSELQDQFGALHDAQLFGSEIARRIAKVLASTAKADPGPEKATTASPATGGEDDRISGLLAVSRRLHRDEETAFKKVQAEWLGDAPNQLWADIESVAAQLDDIAAEGREVERKFLLRRKVDELPPGVELEIEQGYLPGERLVERVRRVHGPDGTRYYRTVKVGRGLEREEIEEKATKKTFDALWPLTEGRRVRKRRCAIEHDGRRWEIDEFLDRDLMLAEVELESPDEAVAIPAWLEPAIDREVTDDDAFSNRSLAR